MSAKSSNIYQKEIIQRLGDLLKEAERLCERNSNNPYDLGTINGIKLSMQTILKPLLSIDNTSKKG